MKKTKDFAFKQFTVYGGYSGMPVSTDGVLLGSWMPIHTISNLLDIGTGTGLLSLMCAQRAPLLAITAIDIDTSAIEAAQHNFTQSPWNHRLTLNQGNILDHPFSTLFDAIICNPPYFNSGEVAQVEQRAVARHTDNLSHHALLHRCHQLLTDDGYGCFILPLVEGDAFIQLALNMGWHLHTRVEVQPIEHKPISRLLIKLGKRAQETQHNSLLIRENNQYTNAFIELTKDFYLKM